MVQAQTVFHTRARQSALAAKMVNKDAVNLVYRTWNNQNGLPQNTVFDLEFDGQGYLWCATEEGLVRFDGSELSLFTNDDIPELNSNNFYSIQYVNKGQSAGLWAASSNGILHYDGRHFRVIDLRQELGGGWIQSLQVDQKSGIVWIGTSLGKIFILVDQLIWQITGFPSGFSGNWETMTVWENGILAAGSGGLFYIPQPDKKRLETLKATALAQGTLPNKPFDGKIKQAIRAIPPFIGMHLVSLHQSPDKKLFALGSTRNGAHIVSADSLAAWLNNTALAISPTTLSKENGLSDSYINSVQFDSSGYLWLGTRLNGFYIYDYRNAILHRSPQNMLEEDGIRSIKIGQNGDVWLGANSSGLVQLKAGSIQMLQPNPSLSGKIALPIFQHPNGDVWIGTAGQGVNKIRNGTNTKYSVADGLPHPLTLSIFGKGNRVYIGTSDGLAAYDYSTNKISLIAGKKNGLKDPSIIAAYETKQNLLIYSTRQGGLYTSSKAVPIHLPSGVRGANVLNFHEDDQGNLWLGTRGGGVICLVQPHQVLSEAAQGKYTKIDTSTLPILVFNNKSSFPADVVYDIKQAKIKGKYQGFWMATNKGLVVGKALYKTPKDIMLSTELLTKEDGLRFNELYQVVEDNLGFLWISGNMGIQRLSIQNVEDYLKLGNRKGAGTYGERILLQAELFNNLDGMLNTEANGGVFPAGWKLNDGKIYFPTVQGVAVVDPSQIPVIRSRNPVLIQHLRFQDSTISNLSNYKLPPGIQDVEIQFTSIDFLKSADVKFYYRLLGKQNEWTTAGNKRKIYFSGLPAGDYTFQVRSEKYGYWSPPTSLQFTIQPFFYQSWWFKLLFITFITGFIAFQFYMLKKRASRKIEEQQKITKAQLAGQEKERQVIGSELHDNINQQLTSVKLYLSLASNQSDGQQFIHKSEEVIRHVIQEIRTLCKSLTPPSLKDIGLREALEDLIETYAITAAFQVHLHIEVETEQLEEELQFSIFRITQELLNNAVKHAEATDIFIKMWLNKEDNKLNLTVRDNGKGFNPDQKSSGVGFTNIRNRLSLYNGKMDIHSEPGKGCTTHIFLYLSN